MNRISLFGAFCKLAKLTKANFIILKTTKTLDMQISLVKVPSDNASIHENEFLR